MKIILFSLLLILSYGPAFAGYCGSWGATGSAPWYVTTDSGGGTASATYANINACVNTHSAPDDTINTTATGTVDWDSNHLTIIRGVILVGPGRDNLTISSSAGTTGNGIVNIHPNATAISDEETISIEGITWDGEDAAFVILDITGSDESATKAFKNLIIKDCRFKDTSTSATATIYPRGQIRGVIANNIFDRCRVILKPMGNDSKTEWENSAFNDFSYGSSDNLYFEDNTIQWSTSFSPSGYPGWIETGQGARVVVRYNTWNFTNTVNEDNVWDMHGFQNWTGGAGGQTGTMISEYYGNILTGIDEAFTWSGQRGSWALVFNNRLTDTASIVSLHARQHDAGCNDDVDADWPPPNSQITNSFYFNNWRNGSLLDANNDPWPAYNNDCAPDDDVDLFNYAAGCTTSDCQGGIGAGSSAPTGDCLLGTGYWVTSYSPATTPPTTMADMRTYIQAGDFYKCTSTNTWEKYFEPYEYPHPLRDAAVVVPPNAIQGVSISELKVTDNLTAWNRTDGLR